MLNNEYFYFRTGGPYDTHLDIDKIFDPTNGGIIDMVMLPEIFLEHPVVSVKVKKGRLGHGFSWKVLCVLDKG